MRDREIVAQYSRLFYQSWLSTWADTHWLGVPVEKPAGDLWIYQELITRLRPDFIVETGTRYGGSALYLATVCEALDHGSVITIDIEPLASSESCRRSHPRITYLTGSSTSPDTLSEVRRLVEGAETVMVILDSDHSMTHVADELRIYADVVTEASYMIAEDTHYNGHPVCDDGGPGPWEAVEVFLKERPDFVPDPACEKFLHTFSPRGFLRKCGTDTDAAQLARAEATLAEREAEIEELRRSAVGQEAVREALAVERQRADEAEAAAAAERRRADEAQAAVRHVERSSSWTITAPLRRLGALVSGRDGRR